VLLRRRAPEKFVKFAGPARTKVGEELNLLDKDRFAFCWIVDFPMYEWNEEEKKIDFSHNPFSMPNMAPTNFSRSTRRTRRRSSPSRRSSTTSSATASSCRRARSATTGRMS
jgi:aspartyl-tRNA synthetase